MAIPINTIIRNATRKYLAGLDPKNPPPASVIEEKLLDQVNADINAENVGRAKNHLMPLLQKLTNTQVAQVMLRLNRVVRIAPSGKNTDRDLDMLAIYAADGEDEGIYLTSEDSFRSVAREYNYSLTTKDFIEIRAALMDSAPRTFRCDDRDMIAVKNGIFDYRTKQLRPFSPALVFVSKSRVAYNPLAINVSIKHPADGTIWDVESWMSELSDDPEIVELLWQILGAIIRPHVRWNKSAWFYAEQGNNGKGTLCALMRNLTGPSTYASIPINDFGKEFLLEPLARASAIIVDENDVGTYVDKAANLKAVITNDVISINRKHKVPIAYQFWGFMVQCLNEFPRIKDQSDSFYRRQLFVPFTKCFTGAERKYIKDDYLNRDDVLEYVLKRVLHMNYYELSEPAATKLVLDNYKLFNDPVREFFDEFEEQFTWDLLPFPFLYDLYRSWFTKTRPSGSPIGRNGFIQKIVETSRNSALWDCPDKNINVRAGTKFAVPEPLVIEFDLKDWMNSTYTGSGPQRAIPHPVKATYRGLQRRVIAGIATVGSGDPADGNPSGFTDKSDTPFTADPADGTAPAEPDDQAANSTT